MTVGSQVVDRTYVVQSTVGGSNQPTLQGRYVSKSWNGGDSAKLSSRVLGRKRTYTTVVPERQIVSRKGRILVQPARVVRHSFREKSPKRIDFRNPNGYAMSGVDSVRTPYTFVLSSTIGGPTFNTTYSNWNFDATYTGMLPALPDWTANDDINLILKLKEKVRGSDFNLSVFLGESHQTLRMIGDSAIRIARGIKLLKTGNVIGAVHEMSKSAQQTEVIRKSMRPSLWTANLRRNASNQMSSNWLELQYGWLPLLGDIDTGAKLLAHQLNVPFRQRVSAQTSLRREEVDVPGLGGMKWAECYALRRKRIIAYLSEPESIPKMTGLMNPELVAWELVPFSFVADWVAPLGDFLDARGFASGLSGTFVTTQVDMQVVNGFKAGVKTNPPSIQTATILSEGAIRHTKVSMTRSVSSSLAVPMPVVKPLGKIASWKHCANGIALLAGLSRTALNNPPTKAKLKPRMPVINNDQLFASFDLRR